MDAQIHSSFLSESINIPNGLIGESLWSKSVFDSGVLKVSDVYISRNCVLDWAGMENVGISLSPLFQMVLRKGYPVQQEQRRVKCFV